MTFFSLKIWRLLQLVFFFPLKKIPSTSCTSSSGFMRSPQFAKKEKKGISFWLIRPITPQQLPHSPLARVYKKQTCSGRKPTSSVVCENCELSSLVTALVLIIITISLSLSLSLSLFSSFFASFLQLSDNDGTLWRP